MVLSLHFQLTRFDTRRYSSFPPPMKEVVEDRLLRRGIHDGEGTRLIGTVRSPIATNRRREGGLTRSDSYRYPRVRGALHFRVALYRGFNNSLAGSRSNL